MKLFERLRGLFNHDRRFGCGHKGHLPFKVTVQGVKCELSEATLCKACAEPYLNKACTLCASCGRPIFPGEPVGVAWDGATHPYTHLTFKCCASGGLYCGRWGEGRLVSLHDIDPERYPTGTGSIVGMVFSTGKEAIVNVA